jgi:hypothetical protein
MGNGAPERGADAFDEDIIVRLIGSKPPPCFCNGARGAIREIPSSRVESIARCMGEARELISREGSPAASASRIECVHKRRAERESGKEREISVHEVILSAQLTEQRLCHTSRRLAVYVSR